MWRYTTRVIVVVAFAVMAAACGDGGSAADDSCSPPLAKSCSDTTTVQQCGADGHWYFLKNCSSGQTCLNGVCSGGGVCTSAGEFVCSSETTVAVCNSSLTAVQVTDCAAAGAGKVCQSGSCVNGASCTPGEKACKDDSTIALCNTSAQWEAMMDCADLNKSCSKGVCVTATCNPSTYRCNALEEKVVEICNSSGEWTYYRDCKDGYVCTGGVCIPVGGVDGDRNDDETADTTPEEEEISGAYCDNSTACTDKSSYCFMEEGESSGMCLKFCDISPVCPSGYMCSNSSYRCEIIAGFCTSSGQCAAGAEFCDIVEGTGLGLCKPYCYLPGESCPEAAKCCIKDDITPACAGKYGKCIAIQQCLTCRSDAMCGSENYCDKAAGQSLGCCKARCHSDEECVGKLVCRDDGVCAAGPTAGDCGGSCGGGYVCDPIYNQCVLNCPACGPLECCDAGSAPLCYTCKCINPDVCGFLAEQCCFGYRCSTIFYGVLGFCI